jgi:hypothetical protein
MRDVSAADTSIFKHGGKWWMLTNIDSTNAGDHASELHVFWADSFDSEQWHPHPGNPVILDSTRARNGGLIASEDRVYRVFQVQGFDMYGESMGIAAILELTEETYREEVVARIGPDFVPGARGTHTFAFRDGLLAVDFGMEEYRGRRRGAKSTARRP